MKTWISTAVAFLWVGLFATSSFAGTPFDRMDANNDGKVTRSEYKGSKWIYVDTHNHLVGRRVRGRLNLEPAARIALENMDATGVKLNLILPMPQTVQQKDPLLAEDLFPVAREYPGRFAVLGGGGTLNVMIQQAIREGRVTKAMEKAFDARAEELVREGVVGFGEMATEHFSMSQDHPYETAPSDHPLFLRLADLAAKYGLPVDIHMEAIPEEMPMPSRFHSPPNPKTLKPNIAAFCRLLAHNRKAKILWVHLGWDNTGKRTVALTRKILAENPNLYMSIRIASGMRERKAAPRTFPLDREGRLKPQWLALFQEFPDRFVLGSDEIIKPSNDHPSAGSIRTTVGILEQLPEALRKQIGYQNTYHIYKLGK
ncbi:MAG: amidohydrolase family protein [Phycisphaerae bacterium]|nr:amidohydrolase family protein [Phycisphaerae bacterium]